MLRGLSPVLSVAFSEILVWLIVFICLVPLIASEAV